MIWQKIFNAVDHILGFILTLIAFIGSLVNIVVALFSAALGLVMFVIALVPIAGIIALVVVIWVFLTI